MASVTRSRLLAATAVMLLTAACTSSGGDTTTTVTEPPVTTIATDSGTDTAQDTTTTVTTDTKTPLTPPEYQIVDRIPTEGNGDTVVVLLDPSTYESLTDLDLYDIIAEIVELFPPVSTAHIVDAAAAANMVANPDATDEELEAISDNYLARLDDGYQITYLGPFASAGTAVLGS